MSNVISFCDYRQKKLEEQEEREWSFWDQIIMGIDDTATVTLTLSDENGNIMWTSEIDD